MPPPPPSGTAVAGRQDAPARQGRLARALARGAARGEQRAFAQIFERYHQEIYRYCLAILRNPSDAEDAMQATMAATLRSLPGEHREISLKPWLFRVAYNESISILRRRREDPLETAPEQTSEGTEPEVESRERLRALVADLTELPERQRGALVMRELSGLDYAEIGAALDCSAGTARQTVYEARLAIQHREEGRRMGCEQVRMAISERDGRRLRARPIKSHLDSCSGCRDFRAAISVRRQDLQMLCPPLPVASAAVALSALGGGGSATGIAASAGGSGLAAKGASILAAGALGLGAADHAGVIELPTPAGSGAPGPSVEAGPSAAVVAPKTIVSPERAKPALAAGGGNEARGAAPNKAEAGSKGRGRDGGTEGAGGREGAAHPVPPTAPPIAPPGHGGTPPGQAKDPGQPAPHAAPPAHSGAAQGSKAPETGSPVTPLDRGAPSSTVPPGAQGASRPPQAKDPN